MPITMSKPLPELKTTLIKQFKGQACLKDVNLDKIKSVEDKFLLRYALEDTAVDTVIKSDEIDNLQLSYVNKLKNKSSMPLAIEQICKNLENKKNQFLVSFFRILTEEDTNPKVLEIKKDLQENYGVESLYLNNNPDLAKMWLDTANILKQNDVPMPNEIICSNFILGAYVSPFCMQISNENGKNTVMVNPKCVFDDNWYGSTSHPLHVLVHECIHAIQPSMLAFQVKKIPAKYKPVIENLSIYATNSPFASEIHAELFTKKILSKLNPQEEELFQYLGGRWFA